MSTAPDFPNAFSLLGRSLLGMADWGRRDGVSLSPLTKEGKRGPEGWLMLWRVSSLQAVPDCGP